MDKIPEPASYGLPHQAWRKHQYEALCEIEKLTGAAVMIVNAPTGSGKTAWPAALGAKHRVLALSETKALQEQNYGKVYHFSYLFGKGNYPCRLGGQADHCYARQEPKACQQYSWCEYYQRKEEAMKAQRCALNYAYFLSASWPRRQAPQGFLILDECHLLSDIVLEHTSITLTIEHRKKYDLPEFPNLNNRVQSLLFSDSTEHKAAEWLSRVRQKVEQRVVILTARASHDKTAHHLLSEAENLLHRIEATLTSLQIAPEDWYIRSGPQAVQLSEVSQGDHFIPGFVAKPLTARHHFPRLFLHGGPTVLMSATIGNFATFAAELGITDYRSLVVPSQWTPASRPVYVFDDAPKLGNAATEAAYEKQAQLIHTLLSEVPDSWSGVIHCKSIQQARDLASRLASLGYSERVWLPPRSGGTNYQLEAWQRAKQRSRKGLLAISWSWWTGLDLGDEKIAIIAKIPFPYIGSQYERARMQYDGKFYLQQTAWQLQQGCGRTRRGRPQDYDQEGQRAGLVAVVDGNWHRVHNYLDADFQASLTRWN